MTIVEPGSALCVDELCKKIVSNKCLVVFVDFVGLEGRQRTLSSQSAPRYVRLSFSIYIPEPYSRSRQDQDTGDAIRDDEITSPVPYYYSSVMVPLGVGAIPCMNA